MKRLISALMLISLLAIFTSCADMDAVNAASAAIDAIGKVTRDSGARIAEAESLVNNLGEAELKRVENVGTLKEARSKYDSLCAGHVDDMIKKSLGIGASQSGSTSASSSGSANAKHNAKAFERKTKEYAEIRAEYEALENGAKALLEYYERFTKAEKAHEEEADAWLDETEKIISALFPVTLTSEEAIKNAAEAVFLMPGELQSRLSNADGPSKAAEQLRELRIKTAEEAIKKIGEVTLEKHDLIDSARKICNSFGDDILSSVPNYPDLVAAEGKYVQLRIDRVKNAISSLGEITLASEDSVNEVYKLYNELTAAEKKGVTNYSELTEAKKKINSIKQEEKDRIAIEEAKKIIRVKDVYMGSHDYVGGAYLYFNFVNLSDKVFKYVNFTVRFTNAVGDWASDEITGYSSSSCYYTGPVQPGEGTKAGWHWGKYYGFDIQNATLTALSIDFMDGTHMNFSSKQIEAVQY